MSLRTGKEQRDCGIGAVARLTGLTDHTIRVWERRYGAVVARRAANGRRVYSSADIEKLLLLKSLTEMGIPISQIAAQDSDELRAQARSLGAASNVSLPESVRVGILGDFLPAQFDRAGGIPPLEIAVSDSNRDHFEADLKRQPVDVVILESAVLDADTISRLRTYLELARSERGVLVYTFGRSQDVERARDSNIVVLRSPAGVEEINAAVIRSFNRQEPRRRARAQAQEAPAVREWQFDGDVAPRRFNQQQLSSLANASSAVECECPQHLAQLVGDLSAFEIYSANCASRDDDDAALHRYLHQTTAAARAMIEEALEKVAEAEGLGF